MDKQLGELKQMLTEFKKAFLLHGDGDLNDIPVSTALRDIDRMRSLVRAIERKFPNGFASWMETHHEVVDFISYQITSCKDADNKVQRTCKTRGTGGLYELAEQWTDQFEKLNYQREWDGEFFEEIEEFLKQQNHKQ